MSNAEQMPLIDLKTQARPSGMRLTSPSSRSSTTPTSCSAARVYAFESEVDYCHAEHGVPTESETCT